MPPASRCLDRKSTRLNSSHANISYAVFCWKKKDWADDDDFTADGPLPQSVRLTPHGLGVPPFVVGAYRRSPPRASSRSTPTPSRARIGSRMPPTSTTTAHARRSHASTATTETYTLSLHDALPIFSSTDPTARSTLTVAVNAAGKSMP